MLFNQSNLRDLYPKSTRRNFAVTAALFAVCILINVSSASAATFVVNSIADANDATPGDGVCETVAGSGICTLRAAITEANALAGDDIITLPAGTYTNTLVGVDDLNASGDLDIRSNITINGAGSGTTIIQANAAPGVAVERVIHFPVNDVTSVINDVTIQNGRQATATFGGGVRVNNAGDNVTFNNCVIGNNFSGFGGGGIVINNATAVVTLNNTTVTNNTVNSTTGTNTGLGGGIFLNAPGATLIANNSTISNNTSTGTTTGGANGGGIYSIGTVTLTNSTVSSNTASASGGGANGGGIFNSTATTMTLTNTTVNGNTATTSNAAVANNAFSGGIHHIAGTLNITGSVVNGNSATSTGIGTGIAGGIYNQQATLTLTRSTVSGNTAPIHAGIRTLASADATTTINQSAVVNNSSVGEGGGVINISVGAGAATTNINNSTIGGNSSAGSAGGIENFSTSTGNAVVNINYSTVAGNAANTDNAGADVGGGIANLAGTGGGVSTVNLLSSIVADNTIGTGGTGPDISGTITSLDYNLVENTAGGTFVPMANDQTGIDPQLMPLALNGGTTLNYMPAVTSPVIDTIPSGANGCGVTPFNVDQRNMTRPTDQDGDTLAECEKGSVEVLGPTAASVTIGGRVSSERSRGIGNVIIVLSDASGNNRVARTNQLGYFRFEDVEVGQTYILNAQSKRYQFAPRVVTVNEELTNLDFTTTGQNGLRR